MKKQIKLSKEKLKELAEALKNRKLKKRNKETEKQILPEENKFITPDLNSRPRFVINNLSLSNRKRSAQAIDNLNFSLPRSRSESGIALEKVSPVLKPAAKAQEGLEQISSSFALQKKSENQTMEKPYESEGQKYFSQSGEYKNINKMQSENLQIPTGVEKGMVHMGIEQATKRKSERFFDEKQEQKYSADIKPLEEVKKSEKKMYVSR